MKDNSLTDLNDSDQNTLRLLECVFPKGLQEAEYLPLLHILGKEMTIRAAASFVGTLVGKYYMDVYHDAMVAKGDSYHPDLNIVENLKERLKECGYEAWLEG